jgi:hypothetical protein
MTDKKLESFKIGDTHRPGMTPPVDPVASKRTPAQQQETYSLGFARIETMLEKEDPATVSAELNVILQELQALQDQASSNREKLAAKKAMAAIERAVDLMDYLFQTKAAMESNLQQK